MTKQARLQTRQTWLCKEAGEARRGLSYLTLTLPARVLALFALFLGLCLLMERRLLLLHDDAALVGGGS